uniref:Uncharacterized protein n=1 Tax=Euplotes harpa TaxID=151035 RepID=A0A7S3NCI4_9SPIT|mmetsp:Transcript_36839/g.42358  ORF Transcript_36839/g.42358 Transcript_36839/m.42358 type:complete len:118 (+) Transcript_36839:3-356(+)
MEGEEQKPKPMMKMNGLPKRLEIEKIKIAIIGDCGVGKSAFTMRILHDKLKSLENQLVSEPTICEMYKIKQKYSQAENEYFECMICDTSGNEEYKEITDKEVSSAQGYVLMYAINNK